MPAPSIVTAMLLCTLFSTACAARTAQAQEPDLFDDLRIEPLQARLQIATGDGRTRALPVVEEALRVAIDGQHATTRLRQVFHNEEPVRVEGQYDLIAGEGARVSGFAYWNGEDKIVGEVFERELAQRIYARIVSRRRDPGLLVQRGEGSFGFQVFPIEPDEDKRIELTYTQWLVRHGSRIEYRAPVNDARASIELLIQSEHAIENVRSSTHALRIEPVQGGVRVRARAEGRPHELVLQYDVVDQAFSPSLAIHRDEDHDAYFVLSLAAPELRGEPIAKDVTLVLDRSGSMAGAPLEHARRAVTSILERLPPQDRVNVIAFDDDVDALFDRPNPVSDDVRREAVEFVEGITDGGGTNLGYALRSALEHQHDDAGRPRVVLFVTDGRSDPATALSVAQRDERDVRVFTVGVGPEVDRPLLARLAALKRGRFTFIPSEAALESTMHEVYSQIAQPVLVDVQLEAEGASLRRVYPRTLPDLFARDELRISGRLHGDDEVRLVISGMQNGQRIRRVVRADLSDEIERPWVGRTWAQARVDDLLEELALGGEREELHDEVVDLSLAYNFVTPFTAFLALPASEVAGDVASDIEHARERKAEVLEHLKDATAFVGPSTAEGAMTGQGEVLPPPDLMPQPYAESGPPAFEGPPVMDSASDDESAFGVRPEHAGCASCSVGTHRGPRPLGALALSLFALALITRQLRGTRRFR